MTARWHTVAQARPLAAALLAMVASACAPKLQYDLPASLAVAQPSVSASAQANAMLDRYMNTRGDFHPNDLVRLSFPYFPLLDNQQRVQMSGKISPPLLDPIDVRGLSNTELQARLTDLYKTKLERPAVSISVLEYNEPPPPREVFVIGEVQKAGPMPFREGITLLEALSRAGGRTNIGDLSQVVVLTPAGDRIQAQLVDLEGILNGAPGAIGQLDPFSIVIVPSTRLARTADKAELIRSIIGFNGVNLGWSFDLLK
ncbi:polysaccharide biosynthesis/export family protein [Novosphingobium aquimarinum]|uniref:polysaccharide biosynthesis/export family protein n=1 Tax=Novosphingobium aquimarinum TaxID=2682494 RepID=UPI0012EC438F|nr:polysaccharide biosynthesis/export family protein [Novosphingobium aquimarinum]